MNNGYWRDAMLGDCIMLFCPSREFQKLIVRHYDPLNQITIRAAAFEDKDVDHSAHRIGWNRLSICDEALAERSIARL